MSEFKDFSKIVKSNQVTMKPKNEFIPSNFNRIIENANNNQRNNKDVNRIVEFSRRNSSYAER